MSRNRKHKMTLKVKRILGPLFKRQRVFCTILKGRKPGLNSLWRLNVTVTGRISTGKPNLDYLYELPRISTAQIAHQATQTMMAEQYDYAALEKRAAAMLGFDVSDIGGSIHVDKG